MSDQSAVVLVRNNLKETERFQMLHPNFQQRLNRARNEMARRGLEALLIFSPENLRYLTGFSGEASFGVLSGRGIYDLAPLFPDTV